jgi:hypothetical protein
VFLEKNHQCSSELLKNVYAWKYLREDNTTRASAINRIWPVLMLSAYKGAKYIMCW